MLAHLASQYAVILSKEYALQLNADDNLVQLDLLPVGTGVYQLESYENNDYVRLKPNMNYWGKKAHIQNMVVDFSTEATGRMAKFLNNECDVVAFPEPSQLSVLNNRQLISSKGANLVYLAFNMQRGIGQDLALRQRIARGINRKRIAEKLFYGTGEVADNLLPTALWSKKNNGSYPYQPYQNSGEQAVEMHGSIINRSLDSKTETEEVNQKQRLKLWVIDEKRVYNQHPLKMAEMIRADLATQNLEVEIRAVSRAYLVQQLANKSADYDLILGGWLANNLDPNSFLEALLSCKAAETVTNLSNWCNEDFDFWLQTARLSDDPASANLLYEFAQKLLEEQLPILPLMNANRVLVIKDGVKQADISPFGQVKLSELRLGLGHKKETNYADCLFRNFLTLITLIFLSLISFNILLRDPLNHLAELGWFEAYCYYVKSLLNGDFGISFSNGEPLTAQILQVFPATITLCLSALIVSLIIGLPLGFLRLLSKKIWSGDY